MPRLTNDPSDALASLISFRASPVFEMLAELQTLAHPWKHTEWSTTVTGTLGGEFAREATELYRHHHLGCDFVEFAIDYPNHDDIPGFIEFTKSLPDARFVFYLLGRVVPEAEIPEKPDADFFNGIRANEANNSPAETACALVENLGNLTLLRETLIRVWTVFWEGWFKDNQTECYKLWEESIQANEEILRRRGGKAFLEYLVGYDHLPDPIPSDSTYSSVYVVPICRPYKSAQLYYGYGNATILFNATRSEWADKRKEEHTKQVLSTLKALGDENRLKILKLLADAYFELNGKKIAHTIKLSPSVVSRHLAQLRDVGLLEEHSPDNRAITYAVNWTAIETLSKELLDYLKD